MSAGTRPAKCHPECANPKCRRCYRLRWDEANKERNAELRRERWLRDRPKESPVRRRPRQTRREQSRAMGEGVIPVSVPGWGARG